MVVRGAADLGRLVAGGGLHEAMQPWMSFETADQVPYAQLARDGVRAVLFDLENTLIPPGGPFTPDGRAIVSAVRDAGMGIGVVSNCSASWVRPVLDAEGIPFVAPAGKPSPRAFLEGCRMLQVDPADAVYVGDQVITDILGAQRAGMRGILLQPRYTSEALSSKAQRALVRLIERVWPGDGEKEGQP